MSSQLSQQFNFPSSLDSAFERPYVISWNLTYRCNLKCEHCYLDAGGKPKVFTKEFNDRSELTTEECYSVIDNISEFAPECITILTGGEPLLRRDILDIIRYGAKKDLWVVVGSNGIKISENLVTILREAGVRGMAISIDSLTPELHNVFRAVKGAWENTVKGAKILSQNNMPYIVQTTVGKHNIHEIEGIADFVHDELKANVWNLYFLVPSGRGQFISDLSDVQYDEVLGKLSLLQAKYKNKMLVNAKCAPHYTRYLFENDRESPFLKSFTGGAGGCPAGTQYLGIRPNGDVTPCPYLPMFGGNVKDQLLSDIWTSSELFNQIRQRNQLKDRCGACEFNKSCGGCRARAYTMNDDIMAEDPLCSYQPGKFDLKEIQYDNGLNYGQAVVNDVTWEESANKRMKKIPVFVRGMVTKRVEDYCKKNHITLVTEAVLNDIRSKMPTPKFVQK